MTFKIPIADTDNYRLDVPSFTLDVNQIPVRPLEVISPDLNGLLNFEYNYFGPRSIDLCVTLITREEITQGEPSTSLGIQAYNRLLKSELYKRRPPEATLPLSSDEAGELWADMKSNLWPSVTDLQLTSNQRADVDQLFWHTVSSGSMSSNSAFLTLDANFLNSRQIVKARYGVQVMTPNDAWAVYQPEYSLLVPGSDELNELWAGQQSHFATIVSDSS